jgi:hypothetical protein
MTSGQTVTAWLIVFVVFLGMLGGIQAALRQRRDQARVRSPRSPRAAGQRAERIRLAGVSARQATEAQTAMIRAIGQAAEDRASAARCAHGGSVPVDLQLTGERVAWWCPDCSTQLPAGFDPAAPPEPEPAKITPLRVESKTVSRRPRREPQHAAAEVAVFTDEQQATWDRLNEQLLVLDSRIAALLRVVGTDTAANSELITRMRDQRLRVWNELNAMVQSL